MSLLIDADYIVYKCCAATETEIDFGEDLIVVTSRFSEAYEYVERELYNIASDLGCFDDSILFFSVILSTSVNLLTQRIKDTVIERSRAATKGSSTNSRKSTTLL
jgi:hypothetical protein